MRYITTFLMTLTIGLANGLSADPKPTDSVRSFRVGPLDSHHEDKPNYYYGFVAEDPSGKLPTQVFIWKTNDPRPGKTAVYSREEPATIYGRSFSFPTAGGRGLFTIDHEGRARRVPADPRVFDEIAAAVAPGHRMNLETLTKVVAEAGNVPGDDPVHQMTEGSNKTLQHNP